MLFKNEKYTANLDELCAFTFVESDGKQFIKQRLPLFRFKITDGESDLILNSDNAEKVNISQNATEVIGEFIFKEPSISFTVRLHFGENITANFGFENRSGLYVEWVDFCQIAVPSDLVRQGGNGRLVLNINEGLLIEDITAKTHWPYTYKDMIYPSEGSYSMFPAMVQSQFLAYYDNIAGIYIGTEDFKRSIKGFDFEPIKNAIRLQIKLYPGIDKDDRFFKLSFNTVIDFFKGDWHNAAEIYRTWFEDNLPKNLMPVKENKTLPDWYTDSPLIVTYPVQGVHDMDKPLPNKLFPYDNVLPYLDEISQKTNSRIMALLMHWEGTAPWSPPYVWPPLGGEKMLADFCNELHNKDFLLGLYCSGISYTIKSNLNQYDMSNEYKEKNLSRYMCSSFKGETVSKTCQAQRKSYDMCISQEFTKNVICTETEKMISCGLDYIQILDQNHGGTPYFCNTNKHGHPAVAGKWMVDEMNELLKRLKYIVGDNVLLGCEFAAAEAYINHLNLSDNRFNLNYNSGRPVPIYGYIYHKYLQNFSGNSVCSLDIIDARRSPDCHLMRIAHSFIAGDLMTLVITQDGDIAWSWCERDFSFLPTKEPIYNFIRSATAYRRGMGKEYLVYGQMQKPFEITCNTISMYKTNSDYKTEYPVIFTSLWEADDRSQAQFLANYRNVPEKCIIDLTNTSGADLIDENGNVISVLKSKKCNLTIPSCSVRMIKLKK